MKSNKEIRALALGELKGFWTMPVLATLVYFIITYACSLPNFISTMIKGEIVPITYFIQMLLSIFVLIPLGYGFLLAFLHFLREDKEDTVEVMFHGFKTYGRALGVQLLNTLLIMLYMLLLIVPGIIKAFAYSMSVFVSKDHPEMTPLECIHRSEDLMRGHKKQLFLMCLGFLGLLLLSVFTLFIGVLWLEPYMMTCMAQFYEEVKAEDEARAMEEVTVEEEPETLPEQA